MLGKMNIEDYVENELLKVHVKPNSKKTEIIGYDFEKKILKVAISEPADKNKANLEVVKFFSKLLKKQVKIKSGLKSKEKTLILK